MLQAKAFYHLRHSCKRWSGSILVAIPFYNHRHFCNGWPSSVLVEKTFCNRCHLSRGLYCSIVVATRSVIIARTQGLLWPFLVAEVLFHRCNTRRIDLVLFGWQSLSITIIRGESITFYNILHFLDNRKHTPPQCLNPIFRSRT